MNHGQGQAEGDVRYYKKDFWSRENLNYAAPHFRMRKVAEPFPGWSATGSATCLTSGADPPRCSGSCQRT